MTRAARINPKHRQKLILDAAVKLSSMIGYENITRDAVAEIADVSSPLVGKYFGRMSELKNAVIREAIIQENVQIIAQGIISKNTYTKRINVKLRHKVIEYLSKLK